MEDGYSDNLYYVRGRLTGTGSHVWNGPYQSKAEATVAASAVWRQWKMEVPGKTVLKTNGIGLLEIGTRSFREFDSVVKGKGRWVLHTEDSITDRTAYKENIVLTDDELELVIAADQQPDNDACFGFFEEDFCIPDLDNVPILRLCLEPLYREDFLIDGKPFDRYRNLVWVYRDGVKVPAGQRLTATVNEFIGLPRVVELPTGEIASFLNAFDEDGAEWFIEDEDFGGYYTRGPYKTLTFHIVPARFDGIDQYRVATRGIWPQLVTTFLFETSNVLFLPKNGNTFVSSGGTIKRIEWRLNGGSWNVVETGNGVSTIRLYGEIIPAQYADTNGQQVIENKIFYGEDTPYLSGFIPADEKARTYGVITPNVGGEFQWRTTYQTGEGFFVTDATTVQLAFCAIPGVPVDPIPEGGPEKPDSCKDEYTIKDGKLEIVFCNLPATTITIDPKGKSIGFEIEGAAPPEILVPVYGDGSIGFELSKGGIGIDFGGENSGLPSVNLGLTGRGKGKVKLN